MYEVGKLLIFGKRILLFRFILLFLHDALKLVIGILALEGESSTLTEKVHVFLMACIQGGYGLTEVKGLVPTQVKDLFPKAQRKMVQLIIKYPEEELDLLVNIGILKIVDRNFLLKILLHDAPCMLGSLLAEGIPK
jgi:hypothetical protein